MGRFVAGNWEGRLRLALIKPDINGLLEGLHRHSFIFSNALRNPRRQLCLCDSHSKWIIKVTRLPPASPVR